MKKKIIYLSGYLACNYSELTYCWLGFYIYTNNIKNFAYSNRILKTPIIKRNEK